MFQSSFLIRVTINDGPSSSLHNSHNHQTLSNHLILLTLSNLPPTEHHVLSFCCGCALELFLLLESTALACILALKRPDLVNRIRSPFSIQRACVFQSRFTIVTILRPHLPLHPCLKCQASAMGVKLHGGLDKARPCLSGANLMISLLLSCKPQSGFVFDFACCGCDLVYLGPLREAPL